MGVNIEREKIILKGYASVGDVKKFMQCGYVRAKAIMDEINQQVHNEGKKAFSDKVLAKRLLLYLELSEKKVFEYAEIERKKKRSLREQTPRRKLEQKIYVFIITENGGKNNEHKKNAE